MEAQKRMEIPMKRWKFKTKVTVDIVLATAFIFNIVTALILLFSTGGGRGQSAGPVNLFDFNSRSSLRLMHDWTGLLIIALIIFHLMLNWRTIICYFKNILRSAKVAKVEQTCKNI